MSIEIERILKQLEEQLKFESYSFTRDQQDAIAARISMLRAVIADAYANQEKLV